MALIPSLLRSRSIVLLFLILFTSLPLSAQRPLGERAVKSKIDHEVKHASQSVTGRECRDHVAWLADDARGGRLAGTLGAIDSANYIERFFMNQSLKPGGLNGEWRQSFIIPGRTGQRGPLETSNLLRLKVSEEALRSVNLKYATEFLPHTDSPDSELSGDCVFTFGELVASDPRGRDPLKNRIVVLPVPEALSRKDLGDFCEQISSRGSTGLILVGAGAAPADRLQPDSWALGSGERLPVPVVRVFSTGCEKLWKISGRPERSWIFQSTDDGPLPMGRPRIELEIRREGRDLSQGSNVLARFMGSDPKLRSEFVVIGAHYDHVGRGMIDGLSRGGKGEIHNGADDNASGVAAMLEIAEAYALLSKKPKRSILFVAFDAEELGLHGSSAFVASSGYDHERLHGMINLDMIGRNDLQSVMVGKRSSDVSLGMHLARSAKALGMTLDEEGMEEFLDRSDQAPFLRAGIPSVFFFGGLHDDYHMPQDDLESVSPEKISNVARLAFLTSWFLANEAESVSSDPSSN